MNIRVNRIDQVTHTQEVAAPKLGGGQVGKPRLHEIQPRRARRNEVQVKPRMLLQPALDRGIFVRRVVVDDACTSTSDGVSASSTFKNFRNS